MLRTSSTSAVVVMMGVKDDQVQQVSGLVDGLKSGGGCLSLVDRLMFELHIDESASLFVAF